MLRGRAENEEKEEEDYANVSKQLWSNPDSEKYKTEERQTHKPSEGRNSTTQ